MLTQHTIPRWAAAAILLVSALLPPGCRAGGGLGVERANDDLRRKVMDLEQKVGALEGRNAELALKLEESDRARAGMLPKEVLEAIPRCIAISIGTLSGYQPARRDQPAKIVVDIEPTDALGRFVQIVGTLRVEVRALAPVGTSTPDAKPMIVDLGPAQVRDSYHAGLLGPIYSVEIPAPALQPPGDLVMRARFSDALTGHDHATELTRPIRAAPETTGSH